MKSGRKKGQTAKNPAKTTAFTLKDLDRDFWRRVKILALQRDTNVKSLIIDLLTKEIEKEIVS